MKKKRLLCAHTASRQKSAGVFFYSLQTPRHALSCFAICLAPPAFVLIDAKFKMRGHCLSHRRAKHDARAITPGGEHSDKTGEAIKILEKLLDPDGGRGAIDGRRCALKLPRQLPVGRWRRRSRNDVIS